MSAEKIKELETQVVVLKSRLFDTQEAAERVLAEANQVRELLGEIVKTLQIPTGENGEVKFEEILSAVQAVAPEQESAE